MSPDRTPAGGSEPPPSAPSGVPAYLVAPLADSTRRAYNGALRRLDAALAGRPLTDDTLAEHVAELHAAGKAPASVKTVVAAVRFRAKAQGIAAPVGPLTARAMADIRRHGRARGRGQVQGVDWAQADAAAEAAAKEAQTDGENWKDRRKRRAGLRDAALIAVASDAMLRVFEIVALDVDDIAGQDDGTARLRVYGRKTTGTEPEGGGAPRFLRRSTWRRVTAWLEETGLDQGPLFRRVSRSGQVGDGPLAPHSVRKIVRDRCVAAGIQGRISGHSLRLGAAQSLAQVDAVACLRPDGNPEQGPPDENRVMD